MICGNFVCWFYFMILKTVLKSIFCEFYSAGSVVDFKFFILKPFAVFFNT